jgi:hypothetical protein
MKKERKMLWHWHIRGNSVIICIENWQYMYVIANVVGLKLPPENKNICVIFMVKSYLQMYLTNINVQEFSNLNS